MSNQSRYVIYYICILLIVILLGAYFNHNAVLVKNFSSSFISRFQINARFQATTSATTRKGPGGYVIGWDFMEGQTCASRNLLGMMHWASDLNLRVVEPCVYNSFFNFANCVSALNQSSNSIRPLLFRDYFDIDYWNNQILSHKIGTPLLAWEKFITNMPKGAIIVYTWTLSGEDKKPVVFIDDEIEEGCYHVYDKVTSRPQFSKKIFSSLGIQIIREVCFRYDSSVPLDLQWFNGHILGNHAPSDVLIVFAQWSGTFQSRIFLTKYAKHEEAYDYLKPSQRVIEHSRKYTQQFLGVDNYVAIHLRTVKIAMLLSYKRKSQEDIVKFLNETCSQEVSTTLQKLKGKRFLALDLGTFGNHDPVEVEFTNDSVNEIVATLISVVYGDAWNKTQWEDSFVQAAGGITDSGYIAMMQKMLVSNAACIVLGGMGGFQQSLMQMYNEKTKDHCVHKVCAV